MVNPHLANFEDIWNNSLLVFDTNSLLRIYEWNIDKAIEFKDVLKFKVESIWTPHQVNLEFTKHLEDAEAMNKYTAIIEKLEIQSIKWGTVKKAFNRWENNGYEEEFKQKVLEMEITRVSPEKLLELKEFTDELHFEHRRVIPINSVFDELFSNVGEPFLESEEQKIKKEFDDTPLAPGFMDRNKGNANAHGDFFIWKQMQRKSIQLSRDIIFITLDQKKDWFRDKEQQLPREDLIKEFYDVTQNRIIIISLTSFLEECSIYLNEDIRELVAYSSIQDEVSEIFDQWFPDQLLSKIEEYLAEDNTIKDEMEDELDVCIDTVSFEGVTEQRFNFDDHEIIEDDEHYTVFQTYVDISADFDASAHFENEDHELGTVTADLRVWINVTVEKEWQSEDSNRVAFRREAESIDIIDIEFLKASGDFDDDQDPDEYDDHDHDYDYDDNSYDEYLERKYEFEED